MAGGLRWSSVPWGALVIRSSPVPDYVLTCLWVEARSASKFRCCCYSGTGGSCREGRIGLGCFNPLSRAAAGPFSSATWTCCRAA
ncbi:hypothetical protein BC826DRAFT_59775 [Russula brevipes]|nr:hypothetical protein BC826DRAFT_59775 [Russula brevipes]